MKTKTQIALVGLSLVFAYLTSACASLNPNTEGQIMAALEARKDGFKQCYVGALDRNRETKGNVGLVLKLHEETGAVTSSDVEKSDIQDAEMPPCVAGVAKDITLPEPPGVPVEGHYDIAFGYE